MRPRHIRAGLWTYGPFTVRRSGGFWELVRDDVVIRTNIGSLRAAFARADDVLAEAGIRIDP